MKVLSAAPGDESVRLASTREAHALARLTHPHIGAVYELGQAEGIDFIVMELVTGPSLADRIARADLPVANAVRLAAQVAAALEAAHAHGVVHRDLKPANVRLTPQGDAKVLDFGLARLAEPQTTTARETRPTLSGTVAGTIPYMSPGSFGAKRWTDDPTSGRSEF